VRPRTDGTYTVRIRIIFKRIPKYYTTKINLTEPEYITLATGKPRNGLNQTKTIIFELIKKANDIINKMDSFSFEAFEKKFLNRFGDWNNVWFAFEEHINALQKAGKPGTASTYITARNSFKHFSTNDKLSFNDITVKWLQDYENWMKIEGKKLKDVREAASVTTISINTRCLRKLYNMAIFEGEAKLEKYPFGSDEKGLYQPPEANNIKKALPKSDVLKILEYNPEPGTAEHFNRDLWLFSYLCNGMNISDITRLKYSQVQNNERLVFIRQKTASKRKLKPIVVELTEQTIEIINRWGQKPATGDKHVFPILINGLTPEQEWAKVRQATKQCNKYLKRIALKIGIDENISTYYARHSYASILKLAGEDVAYISESLGHSNLQTTENYLSSFDTEKRKKAQSKLL
jgi:integrase